MGVLLVLTNNMRVLTVNKIKTKKIPRFKKFSKIEYLGHARFHKKFGPDQCSRFDVYWIQTNKQIDKLNLYIDDNTYLHIELDLLCLINS